MSYGYRTMWNQRKEQTQKYQVHRQNRTAVTRGRGLEGGGRMSELFFGFQFK